MKRNECLIIAVCLVVIVIIGTLVLGFIWGEPPVEVRSYTAEVLGYDEVLGYLLIYKDGHEYGIQTQEELEILSEDGVEYSIKDILPGQQIRFYCQLLDRPGNTSGNIYWYCVKIEILS